MIYRYTKKSKDFGYVPADVRIKDLYCKLGQLEDIEEELGIDLITFVKVTTQPVLYIKNIPYSNEIKLARLIGIEKNDVPHNEHYLIWFQTNEEDPRYLFNLKDYGKTWALTKDEIPDDN